VGRRLRRTQGDEHGFTLVEVLITVILLGILFGIATSTWFGVVHSRQVDSATNQIVSDLRLANSKATNRLVPYQVVLTDNSSTYQFGPVGNTTTHTLPDEVRITTTLPTITIEFQTNGSVTGVTGAANEIVISKASPPSAPQHGISIKPSTARVNIDS
jgi:prepilin-type N-terminal cleavage/methylation domain-containing protein